MSVFLRIATFILIGFLAFFAEDSVGYALKGTDLFMRCVMPALFPFTVLVNCLKKIGFGEARKRERFGLSGLLGLFLACASAGAPSGSILLGAVCSGDKERIGGDHSVSGSVLSAFMNFSGPGFLIGTVCSRMLGFTTFRETALLLSSHYLSGLLLCICYCSFVSSAGKKRFPKIEQNHSSPVQECRDFQVRVHLSSILPEAIYDAALIMLKIGGTIVFCSVFISFVLASGLLNGFSDGMRAFIPGLFEITSGISMISGLAVSLRIKTTLISFLLSFGGICIKLQVFSVSKTKALAYFASKLVFGAVSAAVCYTLFPLFISDAKAVISDATERLAVTRAVTAGEIAIISVVSAAAASLSAVFISRKTRI